MPFSLKYLDLTGVKIPLGVQVPLIGDQLYLGLFMMLMVPLTMPKFLVGYAKRLKQNAVKKLGDSPSPELLEATDKKWNQQIEHLEKSWAKTLDWIWLPLFPIQATVMWLEAHSKERRGFGEEALALRNEIKRKAMLLPKTAYDLANTVYGAVHSLFRSCSSLLTPRPKGTGDMRWNSKDSSTVNTTSSKSAT